MKIGDNLLTNIEQLSALNRYQKSQVQGVGTDKFGNLLSSALNQLLLETDTQLADQSSMVSNTFNPNLLGMMGNNNGLGSLIAYTILNSGGLNSILGSVATLTDSNVSDSGTENTLLSTNTSQFVNNSQENDYESLRFSQISPEELDKKMSGKLQGMGQVFCQAGQLFNVDPALLVAISQHETGNGKSQAANEKNNIAGMMGSNGLKSYPSVEASIMDMARNIGSNYLGKGLSNISKIGAKYAPVGAGNDPTGLNNHWVNGVSNYYKQLRI